MWRWMRGGSSKARHGGGERMWLADACPRGFRLIYQNFIQLILLRKYLVDDEFQTRDLGVKNAEK